MTVAELIAVLMEHPANAEVLIRDSAWGNVGFESYDVRRDPGYREHTVVIDYTDAVCPSHT